MLIMASFELFRPENGDFLAQNGDFIRFSGQNPVKTGIKAGKAGLAVFGPVLLTFLDNIRTRGEALTRQSAKTASYRGALAPKLKASQRPPTDQAHASLGPQGPLCLSETGLRLGVATLLSPPGGSRSWHEPFCRWDGLGEALNTVPQAGPSR